MPYIPQTDRTNLVAKNPPIKAGELNYLITKMCDEYLKNKGLSYSNINEIVGVLECCKLEFYRRVAGTYEDVKLTENGEVFSMENLTSVKTKEKTDNVEWPRVFIPKNPAKEYKHCWIFNDCKIGWFYCDLKENNGLSIYDLNHCINSGQHREVKGKEKAEWLKWCEKQEATRWAAAHVSPSSQEASTLGCAKQETPPSTEWPKIFINHGSVAGKEFCYCWKFDNETDEGMYVEPGYNRDSNWSYQNILVSVKNASDGSVIAVNAKGDSKWLKEVTSVKEKAKWIKWCKKNEKS